jgi:hypothetical protein
VRKSEIIQPLISLDMNQIWLYVKCAPVFDIFHLVQSESNQICCFGDKRAQSRFIVGLTGNQPPVTYRYEPDEQVDISVLRFLKLKYGAKSSIN